MTRKEFVEYSKYDKMLDDCIFYTELLFMAFMLYCYETGKLIF